MAQQDLSGGGALLKKSADLGNTGAMINLALVYITNPQDFFPPPETVNASKPSYTLLIKADAAGDVRAHYLLAFANDHGVSVPMKERIDVAHASVIPTNRLKAEKLEYEAAEAGLSRAQYALGWRLIRDERNAEGWDWLKKSFDNGERIAGFDLYRIAHYVWKDDAQAMQYLHASAVQGELASVELLAQAYEEGQLGQTKNAALAQCYRGIVERYKSQTWDERMDLRLPDLDKTCH
jgi:TPR repeat protein